MKPNRLKQLLKEGKPTVGTWISMCSAIGAEVIGMAGFDWVLIDMEHGPGDYQTLVTQLQAVAAAGDSVPIVRVQWNDPAVMKRVLDIGAYGLMVPYIRSVEEARQAVAAMKYPPQGFRGVAGVRASRYGTDADYIRQANDNVMMFLQFETVEAVEHCEAILDVPGIDVAFVGPNDLAAALGYLGQIDHPEVQRAIAKIDTAANRRGIPLGTVSRSWDAARVLFDKGYRAVSVMSDVAFLMQGGKAGVESFRKWAGAKR
jgi:2-keto-3-deoxy-L-rhamnonate aldolase RhmA